MPRRAYRPHPFDNFLGSSRRLTEAKGPRAAPRSGGGANFAGAPLPRGSAATMMFLHSKEQRGLAAGAVSASRGQFSMTGGSTMKAASKMLVGLAVLFAVTVLATVQAQEEKKQEKAKETTLKGTIL